MSQTADFVYKDGKMYGLGGMDGNFLNDLYVINMQTRTIESCTTVSGLQGAENYGAGWITQDDRLYFLKNNNPGGGNIYEIANFENTTGPDLPYAYLVANAGGAAQANDGASCREANTVMGFVPDRDVDFTQNPTNPGDTTRDNVLEGGTHNGNPGVDENDVILRIKDDEDGAPMDGGLTGVEINEVRTFTVPYDAQPGDYDVTYEMCDAAHPTVCADDTVTIRVAGYIEATDDNFSATPFLSHEGGTTSLVLTNDTRVDAEPMLVAVKNRRQKRGVID